MDLWRGLLTWSIRLWGCLWTVDSGGDVEHRTSTAPVTEFPRTDATPGEKYVFGLDSRTVPNFPRLDATPGDRDVIGREVMTVPILPRTSATPGEMCTMDVGFGPDVNIPRTSSNPGEKSVGELGCRSVLGFPRLIPPRARVVRLNWTSVGRTVRPGMLTLSRKGLYQGL